MNQIEQADRLNEAPGKKMSPTDVEKVYAVKEMIEKDMLADFSLIGLARSVGFNDFKLKKGFKDLFGTTVFGYLRRLRMEEARRMILEEKKSVMEASWLVGYSEPHHFTAAFKKEFGYLPSELKRE